MRTMAVSFNRIAHLPRCQRHRGGPETGIPGRAGYALPFHWQSDSQHFTASATDQESSPAKGCVDGGCGLLAALPGVFHDIPVQRCWAHKIRNVLNKVRKADQPKVKRALHKIMNAANAPAARSAARRFAESFENQYPAAVACLRNDLDELLTCFRYRPETDRRAVRTTNAIERRFREVRRRTSPMGTFQDKTSMDRILFAVFTHENKSQGVSTPFLLTHNS
jgi:transposase-like protein